MIVNIIAKSKVTREYSLDNNKQAAAAREPDSTSIFLFTEEAHMHVSGTVWEDIVTKIIYLRHINSTQRIRRL